MERGSRAGDALASKTRRALLSIRPVMFRFSIRFSVLLDRWSIVRIVREGVIGSAWPEELVTLHVADFFTWVVRQEENHPNQPDHRDRERHEDERSLDHFSRSFHAGV
jgi:hypothetical protein